MVKFRQGKLLFRLLIAGLFLLVSWATATFYFYVSKQSANDFALQSKLTGTWVVESGNVLNIRSDGSGTTRSKLSKTIDVFRWNATRNELRLFSDPTTQKLRNRIARYFFGSASFRFEIVDISMQSLQLIDKSTGERV